MSMEIWRKYKHFIIGFGVLFWGFAKIFGIQEWGTIIFWIAVLLSKTDDIVEYARKVGIARFAVLTSILMLTCGLTALVFIYLSEHFALSSVSKVLVMITGLAIDLAIMAYAVKKLGRAKQHVTE